MSDDTLSAKVTNIFAAKNANRQVENANAHIRKSGSGGGGGNGGGDDMTDRIANLENTVSGMREQLGRVESRLNYTATSSDLSELRSDLSSQISSTRESLSSQIASTREDFLKETSSLKDETLAATSSLRNEMMETASSLRDDIAKMETSIIKWFIGTAVILAGVAFTAAAVIG